MSEEQVEEKEGESREDNRENNEDRDKAGPKEEIAKKTEIMINDASEAYRPVANRGALIFFMMNELYKIHSFYKFSLDSFVIVVNRAIDLVSAKMKPKEEEK